MNPADPVATIAHRLGGKLIRRTPLLGGVSADVQLLELAMPDGTTHRVVLRQHGAASWKELEDGVTTTEHGILAALSSAGFPVPRPTMFDVTREILPKPFIVIEFVEGESEPADSSEGLRSMAGFLARLHDHDPALLALPPTLPRRDDLVEVIDEYLPQEHDAVRVMLKNQAPPVAAGESLLHGDFWPGNVLWRGSEIAAVIDWEDAALGDPHADVAGCRVELLWKYGPQATEAFTEHYQAARGAPLHPRTLALWELYTASAGLASMHEWGLDPEVEARMRARSVGLLQRAVSVVAASGH